MAPHEQHPTPERTPLELALGLPAGWDDGALCVEELLLELANDEAGE